MSEYTRIEWAEHTGGPFLGCTCVSPGCAHCYAKDLTETRLERIFRTAYQRAGFADWETRAVWGDTATRVLTKGFWTDAKRINAAHASAGTRGRWFPSMIDFLDAMPAGIIDQDGNQLTPDAVRAEFFRLTHDTPHLDWLMLTKRPERFQVEVMTAGMHLGGWRDGQMFAIPIAREDPQCEWVLGWSKLEVCPPPNIWIGTSVEDRPRKTRIDHLRKIPAKIRFLSLEPLLEDLGHLDLTDIHWVIVGGESGHGARPCRVDWIRNIVRQCQSAGVPVFVKQLGGNPSEEAFPDEVTPQEEANFKAEGWCHMVNFPGKPSAFWKKTYHLKDKKGGDLTEFPKDLQIREFPTT